MAVPSTEQEQDFIIAQPESTEQVNDESVKSPKTTETVNDEFDLSDITATPQEQSREDIIAAAEAAAFAED